MRIRYPSPHSHNLINTSSCHRRPNEEDTWFTWVELLPGTHHIKFIVDDQWRVADDIATAVDDDGSLANYVNIPAVAISPPTPPLGPAPGPPMSNLSASISKHTGPPSTPTNGNGTANATSNNAGGFQISFWSESSVGGARAGPPKWTQDLPAELLAAAREEEIYLADGAAGGAPAPNIPPAPVLPRHLDKLILNTRPAAPRSDANARAEERARRTAGASTQAPGHGRVRSRTRHSALGMTEVQGQGQGGSADGEGVIPVTTASGTDVTATATAAGRGETGARAGVSLSGPALADDASVLPVPSHVVLHHLSTSAIRNGVLAVGNTTRYKKKVCCLFQSFFCFPSSSLVLTLGSQFITTIYYKPT